jgi:hypothetical protein
VLSGPRARRLCHREQPPARSRLRALGPVRPALHADRAGRRRRADHVPVQQLRDAAGRRAVPRRGGARRVSAAGTPGRATRRRAVRVSKRPTVRSLAGRRCAPERDRGAAGSRADAPARWSLSRAGPGGADARPAPERRLRHAPLRDPGLRPARPFPSGPETQGGADHRILPDIAEKWELPTPTTVIFRLRKGVRFHRKPPVDGREVTADDVKAQVGRRLRPGGGQAPARRGGPGTRAHDAALPVAGLRPALAQLLRARGGESRPGGITAELKPEEYGKFSTTTALGKFDKMAMGPFGAGETEVRYLPVRKLLQHLTAQSQPGRGR